MLESCEYHLQYGLLSTKYEKETDVMNTLLVYPRYPETFWSFGHALRYIGKKAAFPPVGLLTVAAMLPEDWNLKLIDLNVVPTLKNDDLEWADHVFISAMSVQIESVKSVVRQCLEHDKTIVAGGPHFTSQPRLHPDVHHLVLNEAEITLPRFLDDLQNGRPERVYESGEWADVNTTPVPAWNLINFKNYASMCIQYSRGCPYDCDFCDITVLYGRKPRTKSPGRIIGEMNDLYDRGWRGGVFFVDDNFIGNKKLIKNELLPAVTQWMKKKKYPFAFNTQASVNLSQDDELIHSMVEAGFQTVFIGIETPNENSLIECGKLHNTRSNLLDDVKKLHSSGLQVQGGFIVGFDSDSADIFKRVSAFIEESGIVTSMVGMLSALPGTKLYKRLKNENRITEEASGNNTDFTTNFLPKMDYKALVDGYKKLVNDLYKPDVYYRRVRKFLKNYKFTPKSRGTLSRSNMRALVLSVYKLGIKKGVRRHFWKLIAWTTVRRPRMLPLALTFAIYGDHFMRYFKIAT